MGGGERRGGRAVISREWCLTMARYNAWMNERLYALVASVPDEERRRDRGAFFGSIHATLDHIVYADLAFLSRFTGDPPEVLPLGVVLHPAFDALRSVRTQLDARILDWCGAVDADWLGAELGYTSKVDGLHRVKPRWLLVTHLFNHQTHHRGQVLTLLSQAGLDVGSTDLPFMP
jgi:uncharacterized damage-inducible protein DinB